MEKVIYHGDEELGESITFTLCKTSSPQKKEGKEVSREIKEYLEALRGLQTHEYFS